MSELSESQLILLDNLIYLKDVANRENVKVSVIVEDLLDGGLEKSKDQVTGTYPGQLNEAEWITILKNIEQDKQLMNLTVKHGNVGNVYDEKTGKIVRDDKGQPIEPGARMATFVDNQDNATVVFRGTSGDYEWHDNGTGAYLSDTEMQIAALKYIESLPYNNITVTGHSKGGNKAQYVAILSDKVDRALSLDGQGFSKEFVEKYADLIAANGGKITSISAKDDPVNRLLIPVAGKIIYIETANPEKFYDIFFYHKPNLVLNENGQLNKEGEPGVLSNFINDFTIYINENMKEPYLSYAADGLLALQESGKEGREKEEWYQTAFGAIAALSHLDDFTMAQISKKYGDFAELGAALLATVIFPPIFFDDLVHAIGKNLKNLYDFAVEKLQQFGNWLGHVLDVAVEKVKEIGLQIGAALASFAEKVKQGWNKLVEGVKNFAEDIKNAGIAAAEAIGRFKDKVVQTVKGFCDSIVEGTKRIIECVKNTWNNAMDKMTSWFNRTKESIVTKVEEFKEGVHHVITVTRDGINRFIDASVAKFREIGDWMVNKVNDAVAKAKEITARIGEAGAAFVQKIKETWERLKAGIAEMAVAVKDAAVKAGEAIARFKDKVARVVKSFCDSIVQATKQAIENLKEAWKGAVDKMTTVFHSAKAAIKAKVHDFKVGIKTMAKLTTSKIKGVGKQAAVSVKKFVSKVARGLSAASKGLMLVNISRLGDLQTKMKKLDSDIESRTTQIVNEAQRVASGVGRSYSESNVQYQVRQVQAACDDIKNRSKQLSAELDRKIRTLSITREQYLKIEAMIKSGIRSRNL
ncbi:DUF2974 domain-containing protein [Paenibacillus vini]|uniref:Mbeg1-like protein n=1 Tax=Paenibacillus vini TaxID=1476024 RepID=UPI0025B6CB32|nr:Mbeg1-like protein [Paenibacillus vini]MDN4066547.1 DUF2974 domain-containing protein [Paenibacillus vini]